MAFQIVAWHWLAFGMALVICEIFIPSFTIFWFGLGAMAVAGALWLFSDLPLSWQLFIWALASSLLTFCWFKFFKPLMPDRTKAGVSREAILGESGQVIKAPIAGNHGVVRFTTPLLGSDEWPFICAEETAVGDRVFVKDISGNTLKAVEIQDINPSEIMQRAIQKITEAIGENDLPVMFLLGEKYIEAVKNVAVSENSKIVVLPADIPAAVRGVMSALAK